MKQSYKWLQCPMQELADILQLAGYENYEEKIAEYANELQKIIWIPKSN